MQPRPLAAVHLTSSHGSVTISPSWSVPEAVPHSNHGPLKYRLYADRSPQEYYPSFSILTMQNNSTPSYPCYQESSGLHHSESASDNAAAPADIAPVSTDARIPDYSYGWPSADMSVIENSVNPQTAFADTAEEIPRVARSQAAWPEYTPPASFMRYAYPSDAYQRPLMSSAETERTNPCTPQTDWERSHLTGIQSDRRQVPSDANEAAGAWSHRASDYHAVAAPSQHASPFETNYPYCDIPAPLSMPTSIHGSTGQVPTGFDGVRCWMAPSLLGQVTSLSYHPRRFRRSRPHPDRVICDQCQKKLRPQSLKRHIKEVHNHIKRHVKSAFRAGP